MPVFWYYILILIPVATGVVLLISGIKNHRTLERISILSVFLTSAVSCLLLVKGIKGPYTAVSFSERVQFVFYLDGLGRFFLGIISALWPLTAIYACSYMEREDHLNLYWGLFCIAYGLSCGLALAGNLFTMYVFFELMILIAVVSVLRPLEGKTANATKSLFVYSTARIIFCLVTVVFMLVNGEGKQFVPGGILSFGLQNQNIAYYFYLIGFIGFGILTITFSVHAWFPKVTVVPVPITVLLQSVVVVKAGAFAVMRLSYYTFSPKMLTGSWGQIVAMMLAAITILFGASMAVKETNWKRRMVYSSVANLSYILFATTLLTENGLMSGLLHMAAHGCIKMLVFFCIGAVYLRTGRQYVCELDGIGNKMPVTFACFTLAACSLTGVPPLNAFVSKWYILTAAVDSGTPIAYAGAGLLLTATLLACVYMFTVACRAWFPDRDANLEYLGQVREADWRMILPMIVLATGIVVFGIWAQPILNAATAVATETGGIL